MPPRRQGLNREQVKCGEGAIRGRIIAHVAKLKASDKQGTVFAGAAPLEFSWTTNDGWLRHQRVELETDLIGAFVLATYQAPAAQFLG